MANQPRKPRTLWEAFKRAFAGGKLARRALLGVEALEDRLTPADLSYLATGNEALILRLVGPDVQLTDGAAVLASKPLGEITEGVRIDGNGHDVNLTIDASLPQVPGGVVFVGGPGTNALTGPAIDIAWHVTGAGSGDLGGASFVQFSGVENLAGGANNQDTFVFGQNGGVTGTVEGGAGGYDTVRFTGSYSAVSHEATGPQSGNVALDEQTVRYDGMEPIQFDQPAETFTYSGTAGNDTIIVRDLADSGALRMEIAGTGELVQFANPTGALVINGLDGDDTITVESLDPAFAADLTIEDQDDEGDEDEEGIDKVVFSQPVALNGGGLNVTAEAIEVAKGASIDTEGGDLTFKASRVAFSGNVNTGGGDLTVDDRSVDIPATVSAGFAFDQNAPADWTPGASYTGVSATSTSGSGTGIVGDITVDADGGVTFTATAFGNGYAIGDTVTFANPGSGEDLVLTLRSLGAATLSTRNPVGAAGNIVITGADVALGRQSKLLADAVGGAATSGDISIEADQIGGFDLFVDLEDTRTSIRLDGAEVRGKDITFFATSNNERVFSDEDGLSTAELLAETVGGLVDNLSITAGVAISKASAAITIDKDSSVTGASLDAVAAAFAYAAAEPFSFITAVAFAQTNAQARVTVAGDITTTGDATLQARTTNKIVAEASASALYEATPGVAVSVLYSETVVDVRDTARLDIGGDLSIQADTVDQNYTLARSTSGEEGSMGLAVAVSVEKGETRARLDGDARVGGDVIVNALQKKIIIPGFLGHTSGVHALAGVNTDLTGELVDDTIGAALGLLKNKYVMPAIAKVYQSEPGKQLSFDAAGSAAVVIDTNIVEARIGDGVDRPDQPGDDRGNVEAGGSITVNARISNPPDVTASAKIQEPPTETREGQYDPNETTFAGAVAVAFGRYTNDARAYINTGAEVDAAADLTVKAETLNEIELSYLTVAFQEAAHTSNEGVQALQFGDIVEVSEGHTAGGEIGSWYRYGRVEGASVDLANEDFTEVSRWERLGNPALFKAKGATGTLFNVLSENFGIDKAFNSWSQASSVADETAVAGAATILFLNHTAEAYIAPGAAVNQDPAFRDRPGTQNVSVEARSVNEGLHFGGNVELPGPPTPNSPPGAVSVRQMTINPQNPGFGSEGEGAIGVSAQAIFYDNTVTAEIRDGATVSADSLKVDATNEVLGIAIAASGGAAEEVAFNGAVTYLQAENATLAKIDDGANVTVGTAHVMDGTTDTGKSLVVRATDDTMLLNIAGGVGVGEGAGVGASIAINRTVRDTRAVIGNSTEFDTDSTTGSISVGGAVQVAAKNEGFVGSFALAAAVGESGPSTPEAPEPGSPMDDSASTAARPSDFGKAATQGGASKSGIGVAGAVAINLADDVAVASITDAGTLPAGDVSVTAENAKFHVAAAGSVAAVFGIGAGNTLGGAFSLNNLNTDTRAVIANTTLDTGSVDVSAAQTGGLVSVAAGGAGSTTATGFNAAGSVSVNRLINTTEAYLDDVQGTAGDVEVSATDSAGVYAFGGGIAVGGGAGVGASIGFNQIDGDTRASIADSTLDAAGAVSVTAKNDNTLVATGIAVAAARQVGVAFTQGTNLISNDVHAEITGTTLTGASSVAVHAQDDSTMLAVGGALGIGFRTAGFGGSMGWNSVTNIVRAQIEDSTLTGVTGPVSVTAESTEESGGPNGKIVSAAVGAAGTAGAAVGGSLAINGITNTIDAHISTSTVEAAGDVTVVARDSSGIQSLTGGAAISVGGAGVGLAISANYIANDVTATIDSSTVETTGGIGSVNVIADEAGSIDAIAVSLGAATNPALAGSATVSVIVDNVKAGVTGVSDIAAGGNVRVTARNKAHVGAVAGQIAASASNAFGASITETTVVNTTEAVIDGRAAVFADVKPGTPFFTDAAGASLRGVSVEAESPKDVSAFAVGGAVSGNVTVAGSFSVTVIDDTTHAHISAPGAGAPASAGVTSDGSVNVVATSELALVGAAGSLAIGGGAGVGVGADVGVATIRTLADIGVGATVAANDSVIVQALADERALSLSIAGAGGARVAVGSTAGVSTLNLTTDAHIGGNANVSAEGNVVVQAQDTTKIDAVAGSVVAAGNVAVGVAGGVSVINKLTESYIASDAQVTAKGNRGAFQANTGAFTDGATTSDAQQTSSTVNVQTDDVTTATDTIHAPAHGFGDGQEVVYAAAGQPIRGLTSGGRYYVKRIDANSFKLSATPGGAAIDLTAVGDPTSGHTLTSVVGVGVPQISNSNFDENAIRNRPGTNIQTANARGVVVSAVSTNDIATAGGAAGVAGSIAAQVAGAVNVHTINTRAHIDAGADVNADNTGAGAEQSVRVVAGRSYESVVVGAGASASGSGAGVGAASVPVLLGDTAAYIGSNSNFATDAHTGDTFETVVNAAGDVEVAARAQEQIITVGAGVAGALGVGVAGSASVVVIDTNTLAAISGDVQVKAGGNVLVAAQDDTTTHAIAGAVGVGFAGGGGAGAVAVTVITKDTEAVIGGGAVVEADGNGSALLNGVPTGAMNADGTFPTGSLCGVAVQARSSEDVFALGASGAAGLFAGIAGAVSVEVIDSDTLAHITGGAEVNQNTAGSANAQQSVNVSAVNELDVLSIDGSLGAGLVGVGASVDVGVIRNDTTAVIGGAGTKVRANGAVDVNALAHRDLSSNTIAAAAGGVGLGGGISVYSVGGNFNSNYGGSPDGGAAQSSNALAAGGDNVVSSAEGTVAGLVGDFAAPDAGALPAFSSAAVNTATDTVGLGVAHDLETGEAIVYTNGGGASVGGLQDGKTYFVIVVSPTAVKLAASYQDAVNGRAIDLTSTGTGADQQLLAGAVGLGNAGRDSAASRSPAGKVNSATNATTGLSSGTTAAIDTGATIDAGSVGVSARQKTELATLTGGAGLGTAVGIGVGIAVVNIDADVSAFVAQGTTINGVGGDGDLTVEAQHDSTIKALGFAGAASGFIALGSAVSVVRDTGDVRALLGARVNGAGNIEEATSSAGRAVVGGANFDNVNVAADSNKTLRLATGAGAVALDGALGAAITVASATGKTEALVGDHTQIGAGANDRVGSVAVTADSQLFVKPYKDGDPMGIALAGGLFAFTAGVTDVTLGGNSGTTYVRAEIGDHATVSADGDVAVSAQSQWQATVSADGGSFGAVAVGAVVARGNVAGQTQARIGTGANVDANSLDVTANGEAAANVRTLAASGGVFTGRGSVANATVNTTTAATIATGADIDLTGNLTVQTDYLAEGDATAKGYGGGVITAGVSHATSIVTPTASATIESGARVDLVGPTGDVTVKAQRKALTPSTQQPTDAVTAVNDTGDKIRYGNFDFHPGDVVQYDASGSPIGGLVEGRDYYVLRVEGVSTPPNTPPQVDLILGVRFNGSTQTTTGGTITYGLNADTDTIVFTGPHNLETGDAVVYDGGDAPVGIRNADGTTTTLQVGTTYYVRKIDERTIKLFATQSAAQSTPLVPFSPRTNVNMTTDTITAPGSTFANGQAVTYRNGVTKTFTGPLVDVQLDGTDVATDPDTGAVLYAATSNVVYFAEGHNFQNGEAVRYRVSGGPAIGGLVNNGLYYVIVVNGNAIRLADSYLHAVGQGGENPVPVTPLNISSDPTDTVTAHTLSDPALGGLEAGRTYYVRDAAGASFKLALTPGGAAIDLTSAVDPAAPTRNQFVGAEGLDLLTSSGEQRLRIDLTGALPGGTHRFLGAGGVPLSQTARALGDGVSSAYANASSGGLATIGVNISAVNITQNVTAASLGIVAAPGDVTVTADSVTGASTFVTNVSGGLLAVKNAETSVDVINNSTARIGGTVTAGGDVTVRGSNTNTLRSASEAEGGGLIDGAVALARTEVTPNTRANIDTNATVTAGGDVTIWASVGGTVTARADADARGFGVNADGDATANVRNSTTEARVGANAAVTGRTVLVLTEPSVLALSADTDTHAAGFGADNDAEARANLTHQSQVILDGGAEVTGRHGVDLRARSGAVDVRAHSKADADAGFGTTDSTAEAIADVDATVTTADNSRVTAAPRTGTTALTTVAGYDSLALFVETTRSGVNATAFAERDTDFIDFGGDPTMIEKDPARDDPGTEFVRWDADVVVLPGAPTLVIAEDGTIETNLGVTVVENTPDRIVIGDIVGAPGGQVLMRSVNITDAGDPGATDKRAEFLFSDTFAEVTIINKSTKDLYVRNINPAGGSNPWVDLQAPAVSLTFDLKRAPVPTVVTIANTNTATGAAAPDVVLTGTIENPIGETVITATTGDIVSYTDRDQLRAGADGTNRTSLVRTRDLTLSAALGAIGYDQDATDNDNNGTDRNHVNVDLVQAPASDIRLVAQAGADNFIDLKGRLRDPDANATPHVFSVDQIRAGLTGNGTADVVLQGAVRETTTGSAGLVRVTTPNDLPLPGIDSPNNLYANQFRPDDGTPPQQDVGFYGTNPTPIAATYNFGSGGTAGLIAAGTGNIVVNAADADPTATRVNVTGVTDIAGTGHIDVNTNGLVTLTEPSGDMRVGLIASTASDVTLTAPGGIIGAGAGGTGRVGGSDIVLSADTAGGSTGIGAANNLLETDLLDGGHTGVLTAVATGSVFVREVEGDLRLNAVFSASQNVALETQNGSILDRRTIGFVPANVLAANIDLVANGGGIGEAGQDLLIDTATAGRLYAAASDGVFITEVTNGLNVLGASSASGDVRLTVPDQATAGQDLNLLASGAVLTAPFPAQSGHITAGNNVLLQVGDNVTTPDNGTITAGHNVTVAGDFGNADAGTGTTMDLRGTITPGSGAADRTAFFGNGDNDTFTFNQTALGGQTFAYGSNTPTPAGGTAPLNDGQDTFTVNQLQTMNTARPYTDGSGTVSRLDTLDLDGQAGTDTYLVNTTGSESAAPSDYVINVLDTGAAADGADTLTVNGTSGADLFLLRKAASLVGRPDADDPAFVALLHGTLAQAQDHTLDGSVERINYDANVNGLFVNALSGDDYVAGDDNSTATTIDGGAGNDSFQIGQVFGSARVPTDVAAADQFSTILTTRGHLSRGVSAPTEVRGGTGDDTFQVYSNKAELGLAGEDGNDTFVLRAFALPGGGYNLNAPVAIDGGAGNDSTVILGTETDDAFAITPTGVFGAGMSVTHGATETLAVNALEGNDTFFVLGTRNDVNTTLVAGAGSDAVNVSGDVTLPVVQGLVTTALPAATHTTAPIEGPVAVEGFNGDSAVPAIATALILPTEQDAGPFAVASPPADDRAGIDRVTVFNDRSTTADTGTLTGTSITGLNTAGIAYSDVEILDILLGTNDDTFTVNGTLTADGVQGGITLVQGGGGNDTITVNGGGGPTSPLVLFGDTAQDGREYSGTGGTPSPYGTHFANPGNDIIDARNAAIGIIAYGGRGNDTIYGSQGDDLIAGGSGTDVLSGQAGTDIVHGDDGINVDLVTRTVTVPTAQGLIFPSGDTLVAGNDQITGDAGHDILFGDHGIVSRAAGTLPVLTNGNVTRIETTNAADGGSDTITGGADNDVVLGGAGADSITDASGENLLFGDFGYVNRTPNNATSPIDSMGTLNPELGGDDTITVGLSDTARSNVVFGGSGNDSITAGSGPNNIVFGDGGAILSAAAVNGTPNLAAPLDGHLITLGRITATDPAHGGNDTITTGTGRDIVLGGGGGGDVISAGDGNNIVFGDFGRIDYATDVDARDIDAITSTDVNTGGNDTLTTGSGNDIVLGGAGADAILSGDGTGIVFGDGGSLTSADGYDAAAPFSAHPFQLGSVSSVPSSSDGNDTLTAGAGGDAILGGAGSDTIAAGEGNNLVFGDRGSIDYVGSDGDTRDIDVVSSTDVNTGGNDSITTGTGNDIVLGGAGNDTINTGDGQGIVFGDSGELTSIAGYDANAPFGAQPFQIGALTSTQSSADGADLITTGAGSDIVIGGAGNDTVSAGAGNDLVFGASGRVNTLDPNVPVVPESQLPALDPALGGKLSYTAILTQNADLQGNTDNDTIDAGAGDDVVMGQQGNDAITGGTGDDDLVGGSNVAGAQDGADLIDGGSGTDVIAGDNAVVGRRFDSVDPRFVGLNAATIYDANGNVNSNTVAKNDPTGHLHRNITLLDVSNSPLPGTFGDDVIAGGAGNDEIFGQLGNDTLQGDGSTAVPFGVVRAADGTLVVTPVAESTTDGDDHIEGNGGNDVIFGGLGQDDLIGGSSNLFGQTSAALRPDGSDVIYGGSGAAISRDNLGDTSAQGHARDADFILGDNGNVYRLVGSNGQFLTFNYDNYGSLKLIPRAITTLDYTPATGGASDIGADDYLHGESGDDFVHGEVGNDVLFGEGQDDQLLGGAGNDRIYGGSGEDAVLGDDGRFAISRNGLTEPLYGVTVATAETYISLPGPFTGAWINITGRLEVTPDLMNPTQGGNDLIYGGRGDDFLHAGAGDDGVSGAEAQAPWYNDRPAGLGFYQGGGYTVNFNGVAVDPNNPLGYDPTTRKLAAYDANNPLTKVNGFFLNFDAATDATKIEDGKDRLFGDDGNDWLVGGTGNDRLFGGKGDDQINADDNHDTAGGLNNQPDAPAFADRDFVYGGDGLDVMIANTGGDRLFDWGGEFNTFVVPFSAFGAPTVNRSPNPHITAFLLDLGKGSGADQSLTEPNGELGLFTQSDPQWAANHGGPRDPQPGNVGGVPRDTQGGPEDDRGTALPLSGGSGSSGTGSGNTGNVTVGQVYVAADPSNPAANALFVGGTAGNDTIVVQRGTTSAYIAVLINGANTGQFLVTSGGVSIGRVIVYGNAGDDTITIDPNIGAIATVVYGGAGNDTITGGAGSMFADGGAGNDTITANGSRDVLVGGFGQDTLNAGHGDDILIGGVYLFSEDLDAVYGLMQAWSSPASYAARIADIRAGGTNGLYALTTSTVIDDGAVDHLNGNQGQDWFWSYLFDQDDKHGNELNG